jgi:hypothetical protein
LAQVLRSLEGEHTETGVLVAVSPLGVEVAISGFALKTRKPALPANHPILALK